MPSNAARGAYYKARTKKWMEQQGYAVAYLECVRWVYRPGGERIPTKVDQFGSDLLAMSRDRLIFIQVKCGSPDRPKTLRKFGEYPFTRSPAILVWLVVWKLRARDPVVFDLTGAVTAG